VGYSIKIKASAQKALSQLSKPERLRVIQAIDRLRDQPLAGGTLKGEFSGLRRLRVGRFRIVYEVVHEELTILVVRVADRREAYR